MSLRILMSTVPAAGHLFPMLPLARAWQARGHTVGVLTARTMAGLVEPEGFDLLPAGPPQSEVLAEIARRHGNDGMFRPTADGFAEMFGGARVDLTADEALTVGSRWRPDLVVHEYTDAIGPMLAASLGIPFATLSQGPGMPKPLTDALTSYAADRYVERGLTMPPGGAVMGSWYLDNCPSSLQDPGWSVPTTAFALRPEPYAQPWSPPVPRPPASARPTVLVTFGTHFNDPSVVRPWMRALSALDVEIMLTVGSGQTAADYDADPARVRLMGFTPKAELLPGVAAVLTHGGIGTVLAALSHGIPLVVVPQGADQFLQAQRVSAAGVGVGLFPGQATADGVVDAVQHVLADPATRSAAKRTQAEIAEMPTAEIVADRLEHAVVVAAA